MVQEGVSHGLAGEIGIVWQQVDGRGLGPLRALVEEQLGQLVGLECGGVRVVAERQSLRTAGLGGSSREEGACRGLDSPGADVEWVAELDEGGWWHAVRLEAREESFGELEVVAIRVGGGGSSSRTSSDVLHGVEDGGVVVAEVAVFLREASGTWVCEGEGREEHDVGELR